MVKLVKSAFALLTLLVVCSTTGAQTPVNGESELESPLTRQKAQITLLGDSPVIVERYVADRDTTYILRLAGPDVVIYSSIGSVFGVDDANSPTVAGLLGPDGVTFVGDLILEETHKSSTPFDNSNDNLRVYADSALVVVSTEQVSEEELQNEQEFKTQKELPLNQQADYIRRIKEQVERRNNQ